MDRRRSVLRSSRRSTALGASAADSVPGGDRRGAGDLQAGDAVITRARVIAAAIAIATTLVAGAALAQSPTDYDGVVDVTIRNNSTTTAIHGPVAVAVRAQNMVDGGYIEDDAYRRPVHQQMPISRPGASLAHSTPTSRPGGGMRTSRRSRRQTFGCSQADPKQPDCSPWATTRQSRCRTPTRSPSPTIWSLKRPLRQERYPQTS